MKVPAPSLRLALIAALATAGPWPVPVAAQASTGVIRGTVWDSISGAPLPGATVAVMGTAHRTDTDGDGTYVLNGIPAGPHTLVFYHPRLAELGVSPGPTPVHVDAGTGAEVDLAVPSMHTLRANECLFEPEARAVIVGRVMDDDTEVPLPGAEVRFAWPDGGRTAPRELVTRSDRDGWYTACVLPNDTAVAVVARFLDRSSFRQEFVLSAGTGHMDLYVSPLRLGHISGRLVDRGSGQPVAEGTVTLRAAGRRTLTAPDGTFEFADLPPGSYSLESRHIAYGVRVDPILVSSGVQVQVEVNMDAEAIALEPVTVTVDSRPLTERSMGGTLISRAEVDEVRGRSRDVGDVLQTFRPAGVIIRRSKDGLCIGFISGQVRMSFRSGCVPAVVFIDNVRQTDPQMAVALSAEAIDHMVLYRPVEAGNLFGLGGGNGVLMIFTKRR